MTIERILGTDTGKVAFEKTDRNIVNLDNGLSNVNVDVPISAHNISGTAHNDIRTQINSLEAQKASKNKLITIGNLLSTGIADVCFLLMSDSTGNGTDEWFYLTMEWLASKYPAYTFNYKLWNDTTQNYDAAVVMQRGTGTGVVTILNASQSGAQLSYSSDATRFNLQTPITPNITFISYSHNEGLNVEYTAEYVAFISQILTKYPNTLITCVSQNPQFQPNTSPESHAIRNEQICSLAISNQYGLIDAYHAFVNTGIASQLINSVDGTHPNTPGSALWKNVAVNFIKPMVTDGDVSIAVPPLVDTTIYYKEGDERTALTGGWGIGAIAGTGSQIKNTDNLYLTTSSSSAYRTYATVNQIDLTNISKLYIDLNVTNTNLTFDMNVGTNANGASNHVVRKQISTTGRATYSLDVSALTGSYYIGLCSRDTSTVNVYKVWGEGQ